LRAVLHRTFKLNLMSNNVQHAAALQARRIFLAAETDRNCQDDFRSLLQPHEIDMHGAIADGIELHCARDHTRLIAVELKQKWGGQKCAGSDMALKFVLRNGDWFGGTSAAVHDPGNKPLPARLIGRSFAGLGARFGTQLLYLTHSLSPWFPAASAGARGFFARKALAFSGS